MKKYILSFIFAAFASIAIAQMPQASLQQDQLVLSFAGLDQVEYQILQKDFVSDQMVQVAAGSFAQNESQRSFQFQIDPNGAYILRYKVYEASNETDLWMEVDPLSLIGKDHE